MSTSGEESGAIAEKAVAQEENGLKRNHEISTESPLVQRIYLKFREAVGKTMEEIDYDDIRAGIQNLQEEVIFALKDLQERSGVGDESMSVFEDEIIKSKVEAFLTKKMHDNEVKRRQALESRVGEQGIRIKMLEGKILELNQLIEELITKIEELEGELRNKMYDALTKLYNKESFGTAFEYILSSLQREAHSIPVPLTLLMFDIDHFKGVNDNYGHLVGDKVLAGVGEVIKGTFQRKDDITARYGGEEFAAILPKCKGADAQRLAEELRVAIESKDFIVEDGEGQKKISVTVSIGVLTAIMYKFPSDDFTSILEGIIKQADGLLYEAKNGGRNRAIAKEVHIGEKHDEGGVIL